MKEKSLFLLFFLSIYSFGVFASLDESWTLLKKSGGSVKYYPQIAKNLVDDGLYFAAIPYVKEYLFKATLVQDKKVDLIIDTIAKNVGVKQFEVLPTKFLEKSNAPTLRYILARKYFRVGKYKEALDIVEKDIPSDHPVKPFALFLKASSEAILGKHDKSIQTYRQCIESADDFEGDAKTAQQKRQIRITRDYCTVGQARTYFAQGEFEKANFTFLDLKKSSHIWPEILFEEAWTSFYQGNYNRTLGKLVTYKAPIFSYYYNPEVDILRALTFMELCLWADTKQSVDQFYRDNQSDFKQARDFVEKHKKDFKFFYLLAKSYTQGQKTGNRLLNKMLDSITRDPSFRELLESFKNGRDEIEKVEKEVSGRFKEILKSNLKSSMVLQRNLIGSYIRKQLHLHIFNTEQTFKEMSYIKLEVLSRRKSEIYGYKTEKMRSRGSINNLVRTDKQYFWDFNGEFWADELGDYVFSLKSECQ